MSPSNVCCFVRTRPAAALTAFGSLFECDVCVWRAGYYERNITISAGEGDATVTRCSPCPSTTGKTSIGRGDCDLCAAGYFRSDEPSESGLSAEEACRPCPDHASCDQGATLQTLRLDDGYWRLSTHTEQIFKCLHGTIGLNGTNSSSPCVGGTGTAAMGETGNGVMEAGAGYCRPGHSGPLCEGCTEPFTHFSRESASCEVCPDTASFAVMALGVMAPLALLLVLLSLLYHSPPHRLRGLSALLHSTVAALKALGLVPKLKITISFLGIWYNAPAVYGYHVPLDLYEMMKKLTSWWQIDLLIPASCLGDYAGRMAVICFFPIGLAAVILLALSSWGAIAFILTALTGGAAIQDDARKDGALAHRESSLRRIGKAMESQLRKLSGSGSNALAAKGAPARGPGLGSTVLFASAPMVLFIFFCLVPSVSRVVFETFNCRAYEYDATTSYRYLHTDPSVLCGTEHREDVAVTDVAGTGLTGTVADVNVSDSVSNSTSDEDDACLEAAEIRAWEEPINDVCYDVSETLVCDGYPVCCVTRGTCVSLFNGILSSNPRYNIKHGSNRAQEAQPLPVPTHTNSLCLAWLLAPQILRGRLRR